MPYCCDCRHVPRDHVAVASRADTSAAPPKSHQMTDRGFEDDKAALQKWREKHSPVASGSGSGQGHESQPQQQQQQEKKKKKKKKKSKNASNASSESVSSTLDLGMDATNHPVKLSQRAIQAWQQKQPDKSPPRVDPATTTATSSPVTTTSTAPSSSSKKKKPRSSLKPELRSPFESFSEGASSHSGSEQQQQQQQQHLQQIMKQIHPNSTNTTARVLHDTSSMDDASAVTPVEASPTATAPANNNNDHPSSIIAAPQRDTPEQRSIPPQQQLQEQQLPDDYDQLDALIQESGGNATLASKNNTNLKKREMILSPPYPPPFHQRHKLASQHDHEGLRDQMIRDIVIQQQRGAPSFSLGHADSDHDDDDDDGESLKGQTFLKAQHHKETTYSSHDEDDNYQSETDESFSGLNSVSDIFSDPALEEVAYSMANDSHSRERYILACRLLRARITQHNPPPIMPMERELLQALLIRFQSSRTGGSAVAFEALSKLLQEDADHAPFHSVLDSDSCDDTVTSIREEEEGFDTVLKNHPSHRTGHSIWRDEKNTKAMPQLLEVEGEDDTTAEGLSVVDNNLQSAIQLISKSDKIRLDGWNTDPKEQPAPQYPFVIMGLDNDTPAASRVLTPGIMEALRGFLPYSVSEDNFWLRFSMVRDGSSLRVLLRNTMACQHTVICVETIEGDVFGSFCSTPWQSNAEQKKWFGTGESFLWKLKQSRYVPAHVAEAASERMHEMEVYPYTGHDEMVQYCTSTTLAVGGGSWNDAICPYPGEPVGIGMLLDGDLEGGETNSCATFANPRLTLTKTSTNEFTIANVEVWTLSPCNTIHLAEQLERQKYFIKEHAEPSSSPTTSSPPNSSPRKGRPPRPSI